MGAAVRWPWVPPETAPATEFRVGRRTGGRCLVDAAVRGPVVLSARDAWRLAWRLERSVRGGRCRSLGDEVLLALTRALDETTRARLRVVARRVLEPSRAARVSADPGCSDPYAFRASWYQLIVRMAPSPLREGEKAALRRDLAGGGL